jgi:tetratricopeptide (TPR) repeat protein
VEVRINKQYLAAIYIMKQVTMKKTLTFILLTLTTFAFGQSTEIPTKFHTADSLLKAKNYSEAYKILKEIEPKCDKKDTLYGYILWYYVGVTSELESQYRMTEQFETSLKYGLEALKLIEKGKSRFDEKFASREFWMNKNIIVSYFGLGQFDQAKKYKEALYKAHKKNKLPEGIDDYFNFDYFKLKDKNIWGYEWYPELPKDRHSSSFTKIVYYVYSTNPDGTDKDQLYRFHVLMYHGNSNKFDYLLERQMETDEVTISGSYYQYTYKEDIDYKKLKDNIKEIITNEIMPSTKRIIPKRK